MIDALRRIDHVVVVVHDLEAAGDFYQSPSFQVGARNRHPWGTENRLIQFGSSFIELITIGLDVDAIPDHEPKRFSFGAFVRDNLHRREGLAMLALDSTDAATDAALFARAGIGAFEPFFFERKGHRPDGSETHVAFTLAFTVDAYAPQVGFFVCQQHYPENFWNPAFQQHDNGASSIAAVGMTAGDPALHRDFLSAFSGSPAELDDGGRLSIDLRGGRLSVIPDAAGEADLQLRSLTIRVPDPDALSRRLHKARIPFTSSNNSLSVSPDAAFGMGILFDQGSPS